MLEDLQSSKRKFDLLHSKGGLMSIYRCNFVIISIQRLNLIQVWHPSYTVCVSAFYCTSVRITL